jgi:hypothetical protein
MQMCAVDRPNCKKLQDAEVKEHTMFQKILTGLQLVKTWKTMWRSIRPGQVQEKILMVMPKRV